MPADAFYEWEAGPEGKQPYAIARRDNSPLAFAGVWEWWKGPNGKLVRTFAILTTSANATMCQLHERMPVILKPDVWTAWLEDAGQATELMRPADDDVLRLWPVSRAVNSVRNNGAELLNRVDDPNAPRRAMRWQGRIRFSVSVDRSWDGRYRRAADHADNPLSSQLRWLDYTATRAN